MTTEHYQAFCADLDRVYEKHQAYLAGDSVIECVLNGISEVIARQGESESDDLVRSCLISASERASHAALDYYVSTK